MKIPIIWIVLFLDVEFYSEPSNTDFMDERITKLLEQAIETDKAENMLKALLETWGTYLQKIDELPDDFQELSINMHMLICMFSIIAKEQRKEQDKINDDIKNTINDKKNINGHTKKNNWNSWKRQIIPKKYSVF